MFPQSVARGRGEPILGDYGFYTDKKSKKFQNYAVSILDTEKKIVYNRREWKSRDYFFRPSSRKVK
jgi:hypothetical protein